MESVSSHCGDTMGYFDRVGEQGWHSQLCCHLLGRENGRKMMPPCLQCFTDIRVTYCQWHFDLLTEINQVCLASSLPLDYRSILSMA